VHPGRQAGASLPNFVIAAEPPSLRLLINQNPLTITLRASGYALSAWQVHTAATAAWQNHIISRGRLTHEVPAFARAADRCRCPCILHKYRRCHSFTMDGVCHACARTMPDDTEPCFDQMADLSPILEPSLQDGHRM
jgi:hypothetical protein